MSIDRSIELTSFSDEEYEFIHLSEVADEKEDDSSYDILSASDRLDIERNVIVPGATKLIIYDLSLQNSKTKPIHFIFSPEAISQLPEPEEKSVTLTEQQITDRKLQLLKQIAEGLLETYTRSYRRRIGIAPDLHLLNRKLAVTKELHDPNNPEPIRFVITRATPAAEVNKYSIDCERLVMDEQVKEEGLIISLLKEKKPKIYIPDEKTENLGAGVVNVELTPSEWYQATVSGTNEPTPSAVVIPDVKREPIIDSAPVVPARNTYVIPKKSPEEIAREQVISFIEAILEKNAFWIAQGRMVLGAPKTIEKMQRTQAQLTRSVSCETRLSYYAEFARTALQEKSWYQRCCSCLFSKPILRTDATQAFYNAIAKADTKPGLALMALSAWCRKYTPDRFRSHKADEYIGLGGRF